MFRGRSLVRSRVSANNPDRLHVQTRCSSAATADSLGIRSMSVAPARSNQQLRLMYWLFSSFSSFPAHLLLSLLRPRSTLTLATSPPDRPSSSYDFIVIQSSCQSTHKTHVLQLLLLQVSNAPPALSPGPGTHTSKWSLRR